MATKTSFYQIAIDGKAGVGKSTLAKLLAQELKILNVNTGKIFRAVALVLKQADLQNHEQIRQLLAKVVVKLDDNLVFINDLDVTTETQTVACSELAAKVAKNQIVRDFVLEYELSYIKTCSLVMEGRDIGTKILPHAILKVFLEADPLIRAKRRFEELTEQNVNVQFDAIYESILKRDQEDEIRPLNPLIKPVDALVIDTSYRTIGEVKQIVVDELYKRLKSL